MSMNAFGSTKVRKVYAALTESWNVQRAQESSLENFAYGSGTRRKCPAKGYPAVRYLGDGRDMEAR